MPARVSLVNDGNAEASADLGDAAPLRYEFLDGHGAVVRTVSRAEMFARRMAGSPHAPASPEIQVVPAGGAIQADDDLCILGRGFIAPGSYSVAAVWGWGPNETRSKPVAVQIEPLEARQALCAFSPYGDNFSVLSHHRNLALERNTVGFFIAEGVFRRGRRELPAHDPEPAPMALTVDLAPKLARNLTAWIDQSRLVASTAEAGAAIGLADAVLLHPGFQIAPQQAVFAVLGAESGRQWLRLFAVKGAKVEAAAAPIECSTTRMVRPCICNPPDAEDALTVVWAEADGQTTRVMARTVGIDGAARGERKILAERHSTLLALSVEAVMLQPPGYVHALWGPMGPDVEHMKVEYTLSSLAGPAADTHGFQIPVPEDVTVSEWAVGGGLETHPIVTAAASSGQVLFANAARFADWDELASRQPGAHSLTIVKAPKFHYWAALWLDPKSGLRYAADPDYH